MHGSLSIQSSVTTGYQKSSARSLAQLRRVANGGGPDGGSASTVRRSEGCVGAGVALRAVRRQAKSQGLRFTETGELSLQDPAVHIPSGTWPNHSSAANLYNRSTVPTSTLTTPTTLEKGPKGISHHNYLPLGVVFVPENQEPLSATRGQSVFLRLPLVLCGLVSFYHLFKFFGTCEVFCRYPCCIVK